MANIKTYTKPLIAIILSVALLSTVFVTTGMAFMNGQSTLTNKADYVILEGNAGNDYYSSVQYSYTVNTWAATNVPGYPAIGTSSITPANSWFNAGKSLRIGMTSYGEFATPANAGIAYGNASAEWANTESWASSGISPQYYIQGWEFFLNYTRVAAPRALVAFCEYSNTSLTEGARQVYSWVGNLAPNAVGAGLTVGTSVDLVTSGVYMLYDDARLAVGRTTVVISDAAFNNEQVAQITFTVIYNKVEKYAIVYKDLKILLNTKILDQILQLGFQEKYEIDLARLINPSNGAFIHYFSQLSTTVYEHPLTGQNTYDVVQAFNQNRNYTFFAAYWPTATEYTVFNPIILPSVPTGITGMLPTGSQTADVPGVSANPSGPGEPTTPWVIVQWLYNSTTFPKLLNFMAKAPNREMRFVEIFGMTDYNLYTGNSAAATAGKALDINASDPINQVDAEIRYMLAQVFNPVDLKSAIIGQTTAQSNPYFMWASVGMPSIAADSAGSQMMSDNFQANNVWNPLALFDKNDTGGTIPYGLSNQGNFATTPYLESFSSVTKSTGSDSTTFMRTGLNGMTMNNGSVATDPQPISGGTVLTTSTTGYWYPSIDPLTSRWSFTGTTYTLAPYNAPAFTFANHQNGIINVGGPKANWLARYFNDFAFAIDREGTTTYALAFNGAVTGSAPTSNPSLATIDFFPLSTWNTATTTGIMSTFNYGAGYAVISIANDVNGTRGLSVYGWNARDTYWASAWASQYLSVFNDGWIPSGTVALILQINYSSAGNEPLSFTVVRALGTITEFGSNYFTTYFTAGTGISDLGFTWYNGNVSPAPLPPTNVWWYAKLPTTSTALVDYDS